MSSPEDHQLEEIELLSLLLMAVTHYDTDRLSPRTIDLTLGVILDGRAVSEDFIRDVIGGRSHHPLPAQAEAGQTYGLRYGGRL